MDKFVSYLRSVLVVLVVLAQSAIADSHKGEFNFDGLKDKYGEPKIEINLNSDILGLVTALAQHEDPEVAELIENLERVVVRVYKTGGENEAAQKLIDKLSNKISKQGWVPIVKVNDEDSVIIYVKHSGKVMDGLVVMAVEKHEQEAIFINIVGEIDPKKIGKVTKSLNLDIKGLDDE